MLIDTNPRTRGDHPGWQQAPPFANQIRVLRAGRAMWESNLTTLR